MADAFQATIGNLEQQLGTQWRAIRKAWSEANRIEAEIRTAVQDTLTEPTSDMSLVVFGSLARGEWTAKSDLDWTLLIDGAVDAKHQEAALEVRRVLGVAGHKPPGREGTFGGIAFSHPIVHQIGGENDTNRNATQRILLLSESKPIGRTDAYDRVLGAAVGRYVNDDRGLLYGSADIRIPRFLVNDIVRYWRTVTVDFVYKQQTRGGDGVALRNVKLRLSRKLVFAVGLIRCFLCADDWVQQSLRSRGPDAAFAVQNQLLAFAGHPPLQVLAHAILRFGVSPEVAKTLFSAYDAFLAMLDDESARTELERLRIEDFDDSAEFRNGREFGARFDEGLKKMFFDGPEPLPTLTRRYGLF
jgi:predicted nucleotidyltransferase